MPKIHKSSSQIHSTKASANRQHTPLKRAATAGERPTLSSPRSSRKRSRKSLSTYSSQQRLGYRSAEVQVIYSSDSSGDVECVSSFSQIRRRSKVSNLVQPADASKPSKQRGLEEPAAPLASLDTDEREGLLESCRVRPNTEPGSSDEPLIITDNAENFAQPALERRQKTFKKAPSIVSSPTLLRASSPTIRRFNSNDLSEVVLAGSSRDVLEPKQVQQLPMGTDLSESTLAGSSSAPNNAVDANIDPALPSSPPINVVSHIPETPPAALDPNANPTSDPISEFCTSPIIPAANQNDNSEQGPSMAQGGVISACFTQTTPTQWYQRNSKSDAALSTAVESRVEIADPLNSQPDDEDDGYMSPLEGFWNLNQASSADSQDREFYKKQFEPVKPPAASTQRPLPTSIVHPPPAASAVISPPKRPPGRPRGYASRNVRAQLSAPRSRNWSIRPQYTSAVRPAMRAFSLRPSQRFAPVGYNHYADDPLMDMGETTGWEGQGISKFS
ncbi:hypothetical protein LPJ78_001581 [Coemansia sp. RSA 989]|nr:hypothetical protein LPJ78_001581 [Coemansia sp. RSA 989]